MSKSPTGVATDTREDGGDGHKSLTQIVTDTTKEGGVIRTGRRGTYRSLLLWVPGIVLALGVLYMIDDAISSSRKGAASTTVSQTHTVVTTSQVVYARHGLTIPVGPTWGGTVAIYGDPCVFWDGPPGLQWETSEDGGKTWGQFSRSNAVHFKAPVEGTVRFTVQPPAPPGEACKRRY